MAEIELVHSKASSSIAQSDGFVYTKGSNAEIEEPPWHKTVANQWLLLMKKNIILSTRSKFMAIFQLIAPIFFMLILFGVNSYVNDAIAHTPESGKVINPPPSVVGLIPRCYGRINDPSAKCITIAYAPSNNITDLLVSRVAEQNNIPENEIRGFETPFDLDDFILANDNLTQAAYVFLSWTNGTFEYALQYNDSVVCTIGIANTCRNPRIGVAIPMAKSMDREIMNLQLETGQATDSTNPTSGQLTNYEISLMQFPQPKQSYDSGVVPIFLLAAIMFNFVILAKTLVAEKETRLLEGMKMMGLLELPYWSSWFLHYTVIMILCVFMLFVSGHIFSFVLFTNNDFGVVFFTLFIFGLSMICMAFLLTSFMTSSQNTATVGFILWIVFCAVFITINTSLYVEDDSVSSSVQNVVSLISPFVFSKGISVLNTAAQGEGNGVSWARRSDHAFARYWPATRVWNFMILDSFLYLILGWWITNVFPGDFGVPKPFYFFLTKTYWFGSTGKSSGNKRRHVKKIKIEDEDVIQEEERVTSGNYLPNTVVVVDDLIKVYGHGKKRFVANKGISFTMQNNQLFCLLGPNGAGKTTLFNMLTGLFPSSGGDATIFGYSIAEEMDKVRRLMGVCPQHDLLWGDLSGRQHLDFFCKFKNVSKEHVEKEIEERLAEVGLTDIADVPTSAYSGGEKRRLSVALALTGNPKIVFLDEPTTGMDPVSRHQVWEIISRAKSNRLVVLTTHSMEEADHLSDRIGIVAHGQLRCLGTNIHLKHKFGVGYQLTIFFNPAEDSSIKQTITQHLQENLPTWTEYISEVNAPGNLTLRIPHDMTNEIPSLLQNLEDNSTRLGINELSMNLSSLEEVFLKIASESLTETSISLTDISTSNDELAAMIAQRKYAYAQQTPYLLQVEALGKKTVSGYFHSWKSLVFQFGIAVLLVLIMIALGVPTSDHLPNDPHPLVIPPPFQRVEEVHTEIPFYVETSNLNLNIGSCCLEQNGFLGNMDFSILNNSNAKASLGKFFPTKAFTFKQYDTPDAMYQRIYQDSSNWITGYYFEELSTNSLSARVFQNVTTDFETYATLGWVNLLSNAFFRQITNNPNNSIIVRMKPFPTKDHTEKIIQAASEATWVVLGSSFIMVMVLSSIVREKKERQRYLMQMAGMRMSAYWLVMFCVNILIYWIYLLFYYGVSAAAMLRIFSLSSPRILIAMYFVFAFNQLGLAFLISCFASDPHAASLATYIYIVALVIATSYINPVFVDTSIFTKSSVLYGTAVIPHIAYGRVVSALVFYYYNDYVAMTWELFTTLPHVYHMLTILFGIGVAFLILHQYFERVFPSEFHQAKRPYFFVLPSFWRKAPKTIHIVEAKKDEPEDVATERTEARNNRDLPLRVPGVSKIFRGDKTKVVVDNLALTVGKTECLALIGPNGSGKTTFINVITGLYPVSSGDAIINGSSIVSDIHEAQRYMGVCPQDSVLYNELTGREHLLLFGRLRNLTGEELEKAVDLALKQVLLTDAQHRNAGGYSGGMKRRLSLAIALIGNPPVVMLDEPTTGVDPFSRRVVWDVIQSYKKYSSILLVTHSMEEAESLADRVAMVSEGSLRCVGRPMELKLRYGVGYNLTIMHNGSPEQIIMFVKSLVPSGKVLQVVGNSCIFFSLPKHEVKLSALFSAIQISKEDLKITDWGILQSSLEDVLLQAIGVFGAQ